VEVHAPARGRRAQAGGSGRELKAVHELSIALSIVDIAREEGERLGGEVLAVHLRLGRLSGVVSEALLGSWEIACAGTPLAGARLEIEEVPVVVYCARCRATRELAAGQWFICPACGESTPDLRQGRELEIVALEIDR
jgi:hydrogenase nickel incorporation protein HypA/HybF